MRRRDAFDYMALPVVLLVFLLFAGMLLVFFTNAVPAFHRYGIDVYIKNVWKAAEVPEEEVYGIAAAIWGSVYTSVIAILISLPVSIAFSVFVVDYAPKRIKNALIVMSDVMAGLPTIIYGIWGAFVLVPFLRDYIMTPLYNHLSFIPLFNYPPVGGYSYFSAGVLLAIMVTPFVSAVLREAYSMIPFTYREAVYALGATRYEATKILLGYIKPAMVSGVILAFGRAIGETVAVSLVIGNTFNMTFKLFAPGYTISSLIANQFGNAFIYGYMTPVLFAAGLALFLIGFAVNLLGIRTLRRWEENVQL
ncbi:phosphate ABC transporter permease subunit PstC [Thermococcus thioreducens]|uniref:Phosphate transport system permease protein n=1 Tax=Thermococcus thioreducens TaxID=277988 RepID=A0A0Q2MT87_9EURY|nr:phosphate ABC transporter permease subunit PstC [Thermococcus thioreducens]ASJ12212.1 phosphate ABC transporter permease subunit PstC [Thermococcus thioreducens]KQH82951.1 phosphate ABC transporter permease [Thermococcus thioreducens]SEV94805.1 phosphate ABC transporter membrane protein 1, PhoT family [Thermococcus thioreducens]